MNDIRKFLICIIQDYCNKSGNTFESERFALAFGTVCSELLQTKSLSIDSCKQELQKYPAFIKGNSLDLEKFSVEIVKEISRNMNYFPDKPDLYKTIQNFKVFVEGTIYPAFKITEHPQEEIGRSLLQTYIVPRGFREAHMSGGKSDLVLPSEQTIIETKIWHDKERFYGGLDELCAYLDSQSYQTGYYILFDNTQTNNIIITEKGSAVFELSHNGHHIHCFFIGINPIAPSIRRKTKRR